MAEQPIAGWYPDPAGVQNRLRYWNGTAWTDDYQTVAEVSANSNSNSTENSTLSLVAFIFMIFSTVGFGLLLLPLAWMVPMSVHMWNIYKGRAKLTTGFAVCALIFVNFVSGILLLVSVNSNSTSSGR